MKGIFTNSRDHKAAWNLNTVVSFGEALEDYRDVIGSGRVRAIAYKFNSTDLKTKIERHFGVKAAKNAYGLSVTVHYKGLNYVVMLWDRNCFTITENF